MLNKSEKKQGTNVLNSILKKTLLLMSASCASFGEAHSMELQIEDRYGSLRSSAFESSQQTLEMPKLQLEKQDKNAPQHFLEYLAKMLKDMSRLEKTVVSFLPQHPDNPANVRNDTIFKTTEWRIQKLFLTEPFILRKATAEEQKKAIDEGIKNSEVAKKKKEEAKKRREEAIKEESQSKQKLSEKLAVWFREVSQVPYHKADTLNTGIKTFSQWLTTLTILDDEKETVTYLHGLLDTDRQSPKISETLMGWVFKDINMRAQALYKQLWPFYLESKISFDALTNSNLEAEREENELNAILNKWSHFGNLQANMVDAVNGAVIPWLESYLKKVSEKHKELKIEITESLRQALNEVRGLEINPFGKLQRSWVEQFRNIIGDVLLDAQLMALQQAAGQQSTKLIFNPTTNVWSVKVGEDTAVYSAPIYALESDYFVINVAPILDKLYQFIKKHLGYWDKYPPSPVHLARLPIAERDKRLWKVPEFRTILPSDTIKTFRGQALQITPPIKYVQKVDPQRAPKSETLDFQKKMERQEFLAQIEGLRSSRDADDKGKKRPSNLEDVFASRDRVFFMHDLPGVLTHHVESVDSLFEEVRNFFYAYMTKISTIQKDLAEGAEREFYLNAARMDLDLLKHPEKKYPRIQTLSRQGVLAKDWLLISALMTNPPKFTKKESENDERFVLRKFAFAKEVKELVMISLTLDNLYEQAARKKLDYDLLTVDMIREYGRKLREFMDDHAFLEVFHEGKPLSIHELKILPNQWGVDKLLINLQGGRSWPVISNSYEGNWNTVIEYFSNIFRAQLGALFDIFNKNMFILLREMYLPALQQFETTRDYKIVARSTSHPTEPNVQSQQRIPPKSFEKLPEGFGQRTLNVSPTTPTADLTSSEKYPIEETSSGVIVSSRDIRPPTKKWRSRSTQVAISDSQTTTADPMLIEETLTSNTPEQDLGSSKEGPKTPVNPERTTHSTTTTSSTSDTPLNQSTEIIANAKNQASSQNTEGLNATKKGLTSSEEYRDREVADDITSRISPSSASKTVKNARGKKEQAQSS